MMMSAQEVLEAGRSGRSFAQLELLYLLREHLRGWQIQMTGVLGEDTGWTIALRNPDHPRDVPITARAATIEEALNEALLRSLESLNARVGAGT